MTLNFSGGFKDFFMNFDFENQCEIEFKDIKEKSSGYQRTIDFNAVWPLIAIPTACELNICQKLTLLNDVWD